MGGVIRRHPIASVIAGFLLFVMVLVYSNRKSDFVTGSTDVSTTSTLSMFGERKYEGFETCGPTYKLKEPDLSQPIECGFIRFSCDSFKDLQKSLSSLQSEIDLKYALPKDAADLYKTFVDENSLILLPDGDDFRNAFEEVTMAYKAIRVALEKEDTKRLEDLTAISAEPIARVAEMCSRVSAVEG